MRVAAAFALIVGAFLLIAPAASRVQNPAKQTPMIAPTIIDDAASYPEGPLFWNGAFYVAEMGADRVSRYRNGRKETAFFQRDCGPTAVAAYRNGLVVLCHLSSRLVAIDAQGRVRQSFAATPDGLRLRNPNDGAADTRGGVYFSDPGRFSKSAPIEGRVFYLNRDGVLSVVARDLWYPNGVFIDRAGRNAYVSEHLAQKVWRYPITAPGRFGARELVADMASFLTTTAFREAGPDGLEIGPDGRLIVALYGAGKFVSLPLTPGASPAFEIPVAMAYLTNLAFAPDGSGVAVGPFIHDEPPFPGRVMAFPQTGLRMQR